MSYIPVSPLLIKYPGETNIRMFAVALVIIAKIWKTKCRWNGEWIINQGKFRQFNTSNGNKQR